MSRSLSHHSRQEPGASKQPGGKWLAELFDWFKTLAVALVIVLLTNIFVFNLSTVEGRSMEPTLYDDEWLFINKAVYWFGNPERGDVVIVKDPESWPRRKAYLVKRIIGVPGDLIEIRSKQLYRNGELVVEAYTDADVEDLDHGPLVVEKGKYFLMGDNRHARASRDSRLFGTVSGDMIRGRADVVLWPITKIGLIN